jgi:hypothetical protein
MAVANGYGKVATSGSVFMYDTGDTRNSYKGEPTTNLLPNGVAEGHNSGAYGNVVTVTDATIEKGPGWKKVTISNRGSNFRIIQWTYITMSANTFYCHSAEFDWGNMRGKGYFMYFDGNGSGTRVYYRPGNYASGASSDIDSSMPDGKFAGRIVHTTTHTHAFFIGNYSYNVSGLNDYFYYKEFQVETKLHPTQYTTGTRSTTQGLLPIVSNTSIDISNVSFDSDASMLWDGTDDTLAVSETYSHKPGLPYTYEIIVYPLGSDNGYDKMLLGKPGWHTGIMHQSGYTWFRTRYGSPAFYDAGWYSLSAGNYYHLVAVYIPGTSMRFYVNGVLNGENTSVPSSLLDIGDTLNIGGSSSNYSSYVKIPVAKVYNRALSLAEVKQNYNKYKSRFNLS